MKGGQEGGKWACPAEKQQHCLLRTKPQELRLHGLTAVFAFSSGLMSKRTRLDPVYTSFLLWKHQTVSVTTGTGQPLRLLTDQSGARKSQRVPSPEGGVTNSIFSPTAFSSYLRGRRHACQIFTSVIRTSPRPSICP